jgi:hypothetical protein
MTSWLRTLAGLAFGVVGLLVANLAFAQGECTGGACGTPYESGGGGCGCGGGSILINNTDMGDTYQYADDFDIDGWEDDFDNCPFAVNADQSDGDNDGFGDACDNCPGSANIEQFDADGDMLGNECDSDADNDTIANTVDSCWLVPNSGQSVDPVADDSDTDGRGNVCDTDDDNDGLVDTADPCPLLAGVTDPTNDLCDNDSDDDGIPDSIDVCAFVASENNADTDRDMLGDACDPDLDNDGVPNAIDNCRTQANATQLNADRDGYGDDCDPSFCFVVDSADNGRCLNPAARFYGRPGPDLAINVGEEIRLRIFTNRPDAPTQYAWRVSKSPAGAAFEVKNPTGTVSSSTPWEFHYDANRAAIFVARTPGEYEVELQSTLVFDDAAYPGLTSDKQVMKVTVEGVGGCNSFGGATSAWMLLGGLALLGWRRRS